MTTQQKTIKTKGGLLELALQLGDVSSACEILGYSRDSFQSYKQLCETDGPDALREISRKKLNLKNRIDPDLERQVVNLAFEQPAWGQLWVFNTSLSRIFHLSRSCSQRLVAA